MRPRDEQKQQRIYDAAIKLIVCEGFVGASVAKIARLAEVSPATLYLYFENKQDMIEKLYVACCQQLGEKLTDGWTDALDGRTGLQTIWQNLYQYAIDRPADFYFLEQFGNCPMIDKLKHEEADSHFGTLNQYYAKLRQQKAILDLPDELVVAHVFFPLIRLIKLQQCRRIQLNENVLRQSFEASWNSVCNAKDS